MQLPVVWKDGMPVPVDETSSRLVDLYASTRKSLASYSKLIELNRAAADAGGDEAKQEAYARIWTTAGQLEGLEYDFTQRALALLGVQYPYQLGTDTRANDFRKMRTDLNDAAAAAKLFLQSVQYYGWQKGSTNAPTFDTDYQHNVDTVNDLAKQIEPSPETQVTLRFVAISAAIAFGALLLWKYTK